MYQVAVRIISIFNDPQTFHLGDTAPIKMITVCFLPSKEHYYATRVTSPTITEALLPLPNAGEVVSNCAVIDTTDNSLLQESQHIPMEVPSIPDSVTLLQDTTVDIGIQGTTGIVIGSQGVSIPVAYYPCFQIGASTPNERKKRPKSSRRTSEPKVDTPFQRTLPALPTPTSDIVGPISALSAVGTSEEVIEAKSTLRSGNRPKRKIVPEALPNPEGAKIQKQQHKRERVINHLPQQLATAKSNAKKAQSRRDKTTNAGKTKAVKEQHGSVGTPMKGREAKQASETPNSGIHQYFKMKRQRSELEPTEDKDQERQGSPERKRRGVSSSMSSISSVCTPVFSHVTADFVVPDVQQIAASEANSQVFVAFFAGPPLPVLDHG